MKKVPVIILLIALSFSVGNLHSLSIVVSEQTDDEQDDTDNLFSLDLSYALTGLLNQGGGIGLSYEKKLVDWLSFSGVFGHMTFLTGIKDVYCTSVSISLFTNYYPLSNGLDKLYLSVGGGCDFMNYFGSGKLPDTEADTLIHVTPQLGWKYNINRFVMLDLSAGYKLIFNYTDNYNDVKEYVNPGLRFKLGVKVFFTRIFKAGNEKKN